MKGPLFQILAGTFQAWKNCGESGNTEWHGKHRDLIESLAKNFMPHGSGFDSGTQFDFDVSTPDKLQFHTAFHHMNDAGIYDGWTEHTVTVKASLAFGFDLKVSGRDRNDIKDYIAQAFEDALRQDIDLAEVK
jgi:hypothetical protein